MNAKKLINEPLVHFFAVGLLLFVLYATVNDDSARSAEEIVVDEGRLFGLASNFEKTWQRPPSEEELQKQIDAWVREEILYREGVTLGFDLNDPVIRRRVAQKMSFVADGLVPDAPDDTELEAWLAANISDYQIPAVYSLQQVYIDPQRHTKDLDVVLENIQASLNGEASDSVFGDSTMLPTTMTSASSVELTRIFGTELISALAEISVGDWQGPIRSGFGLHFVRIDEFDPARDPQLDEVRAAVERDLLSNKSEEINEAFYAALRERYTIRIDAPAPNE